MQERQVHKGLTLKEMTLYAFVVISGRCDGRGDKYGHQTTFGCLFQKMGLATLGDVWVFSCSPLPEPGTGLQPACAGDEERQAPDRQMNYCVHVRGIHTCDTGE